EYPEVEWYINCDINSPEELEELKRENLFIAYGATHFPPQPIKSIENHFFENLPCEQTLIFCQNQEDWFIEATKKGALCFSFESYQQEIESIIKKCHYKIDLSESFNGWNSLSAISEIPFNKIIINDAYILTDKDNQKIKDNIVPLFKTILKADYERDTSFEIYTKDLNP